ncbi:CPBP family intramembrane glutamic endopeptidase [Biostraticola tofi]|uniref:CAAX prenyl protease 2/Lysostaphin resistance protein A-like domain-containing protein n=1 Tax=Biostraticola tofi TaxID=466109 RepID=A0A4R3YH34_9GAMM|nr:CPBP family intramembrane glutamic endopeptidase [Biostraticola tofi]TCV91905.1 hypothetical protein EDC52_11410 [Biostraticola tofi]
MWILIASSLLTLEFNKKIALLILIIALGMAFYNHFLFLSGAGFTLFIAVAAVAKHVFRTVESVSVALEAILLTSAIALAMHFIPGFNNVIMLDQVQAGPNSLPFTLYFNLDKALLPFILLAALHTLFKTKPAPPTSELFWVLPIVAVPALLLAGIAVGALHLELHHPDWLCQFVLSNIFFVSLAEEALFRGYIQQRLRQKIGDRWALGIASVLFGLLHYAGGIQLILFATIAGLIYGTAWMWTGRLWVAVGFHFGLNLTHLIFFTYPLSAGV